ncbi:DUF5129 domain-containing protein [Ornithinimicrobium ciconiae]|uniref:DUF5129 domain-containing protein n=1 Tax=Ornithinimicrobium ciconiae TaxID=2594265 RepID=A0A516G8M3_9MICO|nr:DUF5129 domain-containing protein [Ornithinimicrobium ciconiae]QDO87710.1 DUF5129 domain-containing protein [Ornithinimicrobium ciconiae]
MSIRQRAIIGGAATLGVVGTSLGLFLSQAPEHGATALQIEDTAGILYAPDLEAAVDEMSFYEPTDVAVFTHRGGSEALIDDYALNDAALEHAKTTRPDWLSDNEQKWADDLFILGVDPEGRLVGTYFGENRKVSQDAQDDIQEAMKDDFRRGHWTEGSIAGVEAAAGQMNRPFARSGGGMFVGGAVSLATLTGAGGYLFAGTRRRNKSRAARAAGDRAMANVVRDYDETQVHANLIPEQSRYGGAMLERYADYTAAFRELTELGNQARSIPETSYDSSDSLSTLTRYQHAGEELDTLDDVIADTAALLNLDRAWPQAWERQIASLRQDLHGVDPLLSATLDEEVRGLDVAQPLREFASQSLVDLDQLRGDLDTGATTPDDALDAVRTMRDTLSGHLDTLAGAVARAYSDDESEQETMQDALRRERVRSEPTILSTTDHMWTWITIDSFHSGYTTGTQQVQASRSSSSSGSTSGYSSGGSFSGAGSSSRF